MQMRKSPRPSRSQPSDASKTVGEYRTLKKDVFSRRGLLGSDQFPSARARGDSREKTERERP